MVTAEEAIISEPDAMAEATVVAAGPAPLLPEPAPPIEEPLFTGSIAAESGPECVNGYTELGNGVVIVCGEPSMLGAVDAFGRPLAGTTFAPEAEIVAPDATVIVEPDGLAGEAMVAAEPVPLPPEPAPIEEPLFTASVVSTEQNEVAGQIPDAPLTAEPVFTGTVAAANEPEVPGRIPFDGSPAAAPPMVIAASQAECLPGQFWVSGDRVLLPCPR
jgi:hypothetical protein